MSAFPFSVQVQCTYIGLEQRHQRPLCRKIKTKRSELQVEKQTLWQLRRNTLAVMSQMEKGTYIIIFTVNVRNLFILMLHSVYVRQTVCGFNFPVIRAGRSLSLMDMVQSAFLPRRKT